MVSSLDIVSCKAFEMKLFVSNFHSITQEINLTEERKVKLKFFLGGNPVQLCSVL